MSRDVLRELLNRADGSRAAPLMAGDLRSRVQYLHQRRRRRRRRIRAGVAVVIPLLIVGLLLVRPAHPPPQQVASVAPVTTAASAWQELARLETQAALHEQAADELLRLSAEARVPPARAAVEDSILAELRERRERAALVLIYQADEAVRQQRTDGALAAYRRVIEIFPTTHWAEVARQRLKEMTT